MPGTAWCGLEVTELFGKTLITLAAAAAIVGAGACSSLAAVQSPHLRRC
jgi:hypothetical protein